MPWKVVASKDNYRYHHIYAQLMWHFSVISFIYHLSHFISFSFKVCRRFTSQQNYIFQLQHISFSVYIHIFSAHIIFFSSYHIKWPTLYGDITWGLLGQWFDIQVSFNYCNCTQSPCHHIAACRKVCQFYNCSYNWADHILCLTWNWKKYLIQSYLFFLLGLDTTEYELCLRTIVLDYRRTAVRSVQMDECTKVSPLLITIIKSNNNEWIIFFLIIYITIWNKHIIHKVIGFMWALIIDI